jgi:hypothetical protein
MSSPAIDPLGEEEGTIGQLPNSYGPLLPVPLSDISQGAQRNLLPAVVQ